MTEALQTSAGLPSAASAFAPDGARSRGDDGAEPAAEAAGRAGEGADRLERFLRQLAARGGSSRCYWHAALWPAEDKGLIRATYEPIEMPRHRTRPIRQWCYRVTLTEKGCALVEVLRSVDDESPEIEAQAAVEERPR